MAYQYENQEYWNKITTISQWAAQCYGANRNDDTPAYGEKEIAYLFLPERDKKLIEAMKQWFSEKNIPFEIHKSLGYVYLDIDPMNHNSLTNRLKRSSPANVIIAWEK